MYKIDLKGKIAFVAGVGDDKGFGWAIAKQLFAAGATVVVGTWPPVYGIFTKALEMGKFDSSRELDDGRMLEFAAILPLDAAYDYPADVPADIAENKRYKEQSGYTISEVAAEVNKRFGGIDILVHSLANGPEVKNPLLETSRKGYLEALSASSYSFVALLSHFGPLMRAGGAALTLTFMAASRVIPGYGGGMSSAKAALESDTRTLAYEAGRKWGIRVNAISAGPYGSRAAKAIGFIEKMIDYSIENAPLQKELVGDDVGKTALFLASSMASAVTGTTLYVDNGLHSMGIAVSQIKVGV